MWRVRQTEEGREMGQKLGALAWGVVTVKMARKEVMGREAWRGPPNWVGCLRWDEEEMAALGTWEVGRGVWLRMGCVSGCPGRDVSGQ